MNALRLLLSACMGLTLISQVASAQTPAAVSTPDRHHPFVEHAERRYQQYLTSESQGDVASYKRIRTRQAYDATMGQLKQLGKPASDLGPMLQRVADMQSDVSRLEFVRCDARGRVARLLYQREGIGAKGPTLEFAAFMIHWEGDAWRIGWVGHASGPAIRSNGERLTEDLLLGDQRFALD